MKKVYNLIVSAIKTVPDVKWIDLDSGQLDSGEEHKALKYPAALIRYSGVPKNLTEGGAIQEEAVTFDIRLAFDATGTRTSGDAPDSAFDRSMKFIDISESVYAAIQGVAFEGFENPECVFRGQEPPKKGLNIIKLTFTTSQNIYN
jgi:hypothetical protein